MRTLKLKARPTNSIFASVNQMLGGSSQLPTTVEHCFVVLQFDYRVLGSSRKLGGAAEHLIDGSEICICRLSLELSCVLLKGTVKCVTAKILHCYLPPVSRFWDESTRSTIRNRRQRNNSTYGAYHLGRKQKQMLNNLKKKQNGK